MADKWTIWATGSGNDAYGGKLHWGRVGYGTECGITTGMYVTDVTDVQEEVKARLAGMQGFRDRIPVPGLRSEEPRPDDG